MLANPAASGLLGYAREELVGLNVDQLVPDAIRPHVFSDSFTTPVLKAAHGDSSASRRQTSTYGSYTPTMKHWCR